MAGSDRDRLVAIVGEAFNVAIGARVRAARLRAGLSQEVLAKKVDLSRTSIVNIESATQGVATFSLWRIAKILDVPVASLFPDAPLADTRCESCEGRWRCQSTSGHRGKHKWRSGSTTVSWANEEAEANNV